MGGTKMTLAEIFEKWTQEREIMRQRGALVDGGALCHEFLSDLEAVLEGQHETLLTLPRAAEVSGYTADHLGRMVREGRIPNAGRPHAPRIRSGDLPRKPGRVDRPAPSTYDPQTDARTLLTKQRGGRYG
jgi:hypothetical protein